MRPSEAERRRRFLEEQLHAALEMMRSGYEIAFRALEALRAESAEEEPDSATLIPSEGGNRHAAAPQTSEPTPAPPPQPRIATNQWKDDIEVALPKLPDVFSKSDLARALGYQPSRGTLLRIFTKLKAQGTIEEAQSSGGKRPTLYRKLHRA